MDRKQSKEIRIGLLGFGSMGRTHTWAVQNLPFFYGDLPFRALTAGVCTTSEEGAAKAAAAFGIPCSTANEDDLIYDPTIDVIDICTPNIYHKDGIERALKGGKHVYCDKPLAASYEEGKEVVELCKQYSIKGAPTLVLTDGDKYQSFYSVPEIKKYLASL